MLRKTILWSLILLGFSFSSSAQVCTERLNFDLLPSDVEDAVFDYICDNVDQHVDEMVVAHGPQFLEWHRDYIAGLEDHLSSLGFDLYVPFPMWNPCTTIPSRSLITCPGYTPAMDRTPEGTIIPCNNNIASGMYDDCANFCNYASYTDFQNQLQFDHNSAHNDLGGIFDTMESPSVLLFWAYHAYIDQIYARYQGATLDPSLNLNLDILSHGCCELVARLPKKCCFKEVQWDTYGNSSIIAEDEGDDYYEVTYSLPSFGWYRIQGTITSTCGDTRIFNTWVINDPKVPQLDDVPPTILENICSTVDEDAYCFDFGEIPCLEGLEVTSNSFSLLPRVEGTRLCLDDIFWQTYTTTIMVTPQGNCGEGNPVVWTINVNDPEHCEKDPWEEPFGKIAPQSPDEYLYQSYGNNGSAQLRMAQHPERIEDRQYSVSLVDLSGRVLQRAEGAEANFDLRALPAGLYLIHIKNDRGELVEVHKHILH